jgi:hypothetical protein
MALLILIGPLADVVRSAPRCLLRQDREQQREDDNTSHDEGQYLPERVPDAMDARPEHEHDDQQEECEQRRHVFLLPPRPRRLCERTGWTLTTSSGRPSSAMAD